jgi:hypothetical protein
MLRAMKYQSRIHRWRDELLEVLLVSACGGRALTNCLSAT